MSEYHESEIQRLQEVVDDLSETIETLEEEGCGYDTEIKKLRDGQQHTINEVDRLREASSELVDAIEALNVDLSLLSHRSGKVRYVEAFLAVKSLSQKCQSMTFDAETETCLSCGEKH